MRACTSVCVIWWWIAGLALPIILLAFAVFKVHTLVRKGEVEYGPFPHRGVKTIYSDAMEIQGAGNKVMTLLGESICPALLVVVMSPPQGREPDLETPGIT